LTIVSLFYEYTVISHVFSFLSGKSERYHKVRQTSFSTVTLRITFAGYNTSINYIP